MKKFNAIIFIFITISFLHFSCAERVKPKNDNSTLSQIQTFGKGIKTDIGTTGFTIELPTTHKMVKNNGPDFTVFYIRSIDTTYNKGEAGIYFGTAPDEHGPENVVSKEESTGITLGKSCKSVKYITAKYTWIETVIDEGDGNKIQTWYYAYTEDEMNKLGQMINAISRK